MSRSATFHGEPSSSPFELPLSDSSWLTIRASRADAGHTRWCGRLCVDGAVDEGFPRQSLDNLGARDAEAEAETAVAS